MPHSDKKMISFFLTTDCNLCCVYCYNATERLQVASQKLDLEMAKAGIDWYFENNASRHIRFYGPGEPTQAFDEMKDITDYAKSVGGNDVTMEIQTNGVFNEGVRDWLRDNANIIWMSFDGPPDIQNANRPIHPSNTDKFNGKTSAEVIEENTRWLIENKGNRNLDVGARVTITDDNSHRQMEMVDYFHNLGIKHVWTDPLFPSVESVPMCNDPTREAEFKFDMKKYVEHFTKAREYAQSKSLFFGSVLGVNFDGKTNTHCRTCDPESAPHLTPDGYLSACDMVLGGESPGHMEPFIFGKWNTDYNEFELYPDRIEKLKARNINNMQHCLKREVSQHCAGQCLGEVLNETGSMFNQRPRVCAGVKQLFREIGPQEPYELLHP